MVGLSWLRHDKLKHIGHFAHFSSEVTREFRDAFDVNVRAGSQQSGTTRIIASDTNCKNITAFTHFNILRSIANVSSLVRFAIHTCESQVQTFGMGLFVCNVLIANDSVEKAI